MTAPRKPRRLAQVASQLSDRDWAILKDLARVRLLTSRQVQRLHFHTGSSLTQTRRAASVMHRLHEQQLVHRLDRRVGGIRAGSTGFIFGLDTRGQRLTSQRGWAGGGRFRRPWEPSLAFTDHVLGVSELFVRLREAEALGRCALTSFVAEPDCWRFWMTDSGARLVLKPDAYVVTATAEVETFSYVEWDRATESLPVIRRKAETYVSYWQSGGDEQLGLFPKVVFIVPSPHRLAAIVGVLSRLDPLAWRLFQVVTTDNSLAALIKDRTSTENER